MDRYTEGLREAAFEYGIKRLAFDLDMSESRLYKKLDPDSGVNLTLADFFRINRILGDTRCIQAALDDLGIVATPRIDAEDEIEAEIQELLLDQHEQATRFMRAVREARADGRIDAAELELIRNERRALAENGNTIMTRIEKMHEKGLRLAKA
ncbi:phage regulatory CII family protein [Halomonas caseinilytica]|uniref:phage regulatory CII family protein n=1 Tax=Halomonas caseinilytica TaxID=438744 RepID=UPI0007E55034|nr:phage regulatory CII family protein [Halomonas caseinilytica]SEN67643.1 Phage regulatory protein CII (CP76) [Halomonas caseinilytica]